MGHITALTGADARAGTCTHKLSRSLLAGGLGVLLVIALLTSMGQAQAGVIADARGDYVPGVNDGDPGVSPATGTGTWNYLASDTVNPTLDPSLDVLPWNIPNQVYIKFTTGGSADLVGLNIIGLALDELGIHPAASSRPPSFAVVRWEAGPGEDGPINIAGTFRRTDLAGGGGVTFEIFVDGISIFSATLGAGDGTVVSFDHSLTVGVGSTVDFVVGPNGFDSFDSTGLKATITSLVRNVTIDIKPGSDPNCFNIDGHGVIPVAILGAVDFDVTQINVATLDLEGLGVATKGKKNKIMAHVEDVNGDGFDDLVVQFEDEDGEFTGSAATATLTGELNDGTAIEGTDSICLVP